MSPSCDGQPSGTQVQLWHVTVIRIPITVIVITINITTIINENLQKYVNWWFLTGKNYNKTWNIHPTLRKRSVSTIVTTRNHKGFFTPTSRINPDRRRGLSTGMYRNRGRRKGKKRKRQRQMIRKRQTHVKAPPVKRSNPSECKNDQ